MVNIQEPITESGNTGPCVKDTLLSFLTNVSSKVRFKRLDLRFLEIKDLSKVQHAILQFPGISGQVHDDIALFKNNHKQEPTEASKQPIRTRYLGHVTGYQPIRSVLEQQTVRGVLIISF
eukprot:sb/3476175/